MIYKKILPFCLLLALSGCEFKAGDDLLLAPLPSTSYQALQAELSTVLDSGAVYAAPLDGDNRSTVQLVDLDGDQEDEAIAFFRRETTEGSTLEVMVFRKEGDAYVQAGTLSSVGTAVEHVTYPQLGDSGTCGILISWQLAGESVTTLSVADYRQNAVQLMVETEYTDYILTDIDSDGAQELTIFLMEASGKKRAYLYNYSPVMETLLCVGEADMTTDAQSIRSVSAGKIANDQPAIFVEEKSSSSVGQQTDIFVYDDLGFRNLAVDTEDGNSQGTYRVVSVDVGDVDGNGTVEVPRAVLMPGYEEGASDALYMLDWYLYSATETPAWVATTFRNATEYWNFLFPDEWRGTVQAVKNYDGTTASTTFWAIDGEERVPLLEIYYFTGDLRTYYASQEGMITLGQSDYCTYSAQIPAESEGHALAIDAESVQQNFSVITTAWNA